MCTPHFVYLVLHQWVLRVLSTFWPREYLFEANPHFTEDHRQALGGGDDLLKEGGSHPASQTPKAGHLLPHPTASFVTCSSTAPCPPVMWHLQRLEIPWRVQGSGLGTTPAAPFCPLSQPLLVPGKHLTMTCFSPIHQIQMKGLLHVRQDKI